MGLQVEGRKETSKEKKNVAHCEAKEVQVILYTSFITRVVWVWDVFQELA